ncbi:MAG: hypothetical protein WCG50_17730, partial [Rhodoferax sp.]|uniref:hypothetical protein n=1 Tax=Rhodoferax sp. TaxID=50421 RepID=UPI003016266B
QVGEVGVADLGGQLVVVHGGLLMQCVELGGDCQLFALLFTMKPILNARFRNLNPHLPDQAVSIRRVACKGNSYKNSGRPKK